MEELEHGAPGLRPLSSAEATEWLALVGKIEPDERERAAQKMKAQSRTRRRR